MREHAGASEADVMGYHVRSQLPVTYALADAGSTSTGRMSNAPVVGFTSIWSRLAAKGIDPQRITD